MEIAVDIVQNKRFNLQKAILHGHTVISQFVKRADAAGRKDHEVGIKEFLFALFQRLGQNEVFYL